MSKLAAMRSAGSLLVVAGCGFHGSAPPAQGPPPADASALDGASVALDAGPGSDATRSAFCAIDGIVACFEFEGDARDGSGNNLDATVTGVAFVPGNPTGMAMQVDGNSSATVKPTILDDVDAVTIEAWIRPAQLPANAKTFDILDVDQQYAFTLNDDGTLTCYLHPNPGKFSTTGPAGTVATGQWTHVACTYDGVNTARIYINGTVAATHNGGGTLGKGGHGIGIAQNYPSGSQLIGLIDQLRLLNIARSMADICTDAGALCISL